MSASTVVFNVKADTAQFVKGLTLAQKQMTKSVDSMKKTVVGLAAAYVSVQTAVKGFEIAQKQATQMVNIAAQFEKFNATLRTIEGSATKAQESMKWIEDFAANTPFNIDKVTSSFISLKSYGLEPTDGLLKTLGDTGAAMGKDIQQAVEAVADAVTGENERLKEFGIRASVMGDEIKYSWTNASGEMRQTIVDNNSAIIQSTLESIFNSKYAGAMQEQSKTWNGLISNMQDNWTILQKNLMDSGVFDYLKAIVTVVGEYMSEAFGNTLESSAAFSMYVIEGIKSIISSIGYTYDALETFGDYFNVIGLTAELAFEGVMVAVIGLASGIVNIFESVVDGINRAFEFLVNGVIESINGVLDIAASLGFGSGGNIGTINLGNIDVGGDFLKGYSDAAQEVFLQTSKDLGLAWDDLMDANSGQNFADELLSKIDAAYEKIQNTPDIVSEKIDFGDAVSDATESANKALKDYNANIDTTVANEEVLQDTIDSVSESVENFNETLNSSTDDGGTYNIVNNVSDSLENFNDIADTTTEVIEDVTDAVESFVFAFENTFLNSIANNISSLESIYKTSSASQTLGYSDALAVATAARDNLIANPLDITAGESYASAYNQLLAASDSYLSDASSFSSASDYAFAQATVATQLEVFQQTAFDTVNVLDSMNELLASINSAFADGILSDDEKATIAGVADRVNAKNEILLGESSKVVAGINGIPTAIDSQTYYDNSLLAKDQTLSNLDVDVDTTQLAKSTDLIGTNSVSDYIQDLMGGGTSGISLARVESTLPSLSVNTGLSQSDIASIKTNTANNVSKTNSVYSAVAGNLDQNSTKGKIRQSISTEQITGVESFTVPGTGGTVSYYEPTRKITQNYSYYAKGGFTGYGMGKRDETGEVQAGIVHEGEWVAPKWMVNKNPDLFSALEMARLGSTRPSSNMAFESSAKSSKSEQFLFVLADEMKQMNALLRRVTDGGEAMKTEAVS